MRLQGEFLVEFIRVEFLFVILGVFAKGPGNILDIVQNAPLVIHSFLWTGYVIWLSGGFFFFLLQQLWHVLLQTLDFFFQIFNFLINYIECSDIILSVLNFDLYKQLVILAVLRQFFSLIECLVLLTAHFNCCIYVEYRLGLVLTLRPLN